MEIAKGETRSKQPEAPPAKPAVEEEKKAE